MHTYAHVKKKNVPRFIIISSTIDFWYLLPFFFYLHIPSCLYLQKHTVCREYLLLNLKRWFDEYLCRGSQIRTSLNPFVSSSCSFWSSVFSLISVALDGQHISIIFFIMPPFIAQQSAEPSWPGKHLLIFSNISLKFCGLQHPKSAPLPLVFSVFFLYPPIILMF